ncbi:5134_t:CDS:2 [Funneliformis geosporum]|uniref:5134_t:CDS:1 n=1 Tax=Funneliformis geosporum TaxID=1117311 RepID=A0A9W4SIP7_9GLOM|nr:5134_t:CDS:2 [Funneliformis geosporum]
MAVACSMVKQPKKELKFQVSNDTNMFSLQFFCEIQDKKLCSKAKSSFEEAGRIITSTLILNSPIIINATFRNMEDPEVLGAAAPLRLMPMKDDDGIERLYPQALVKQFQLNSHPEFAPFDIIADFNSLVPYWFEGDPPITKKQIGFLELIIHELIHGLGFTSAWDDYFNEIPEAATPEIIGLTTEPGITDLNATMVFQGFQERAFDKYLIFLPNNKTSTSYANELNKFPNGSTFKNVDDFVNKFTASPQYLHTLNSTSALLENILADIIRYIPLSSLNEFLSKIYASLLATFRKLRLNCILYIASKLIDNINNGTREDIGLHILYVLLSITKAKSMTE